MCTIKILRIDFDKLVETIVNLVRDRHLPVLCPQIDSIKWIVLTRTEQFLLPRPVCIPLNHTTTSCLELYLYTSPLLSIADVPIFVICLQLYSPSFTILIFHRYPDFLSLPAAPPPGPSIILHSQLLSYLILLEALKTVMVHSQLRASCSYFYLVILQRKPIKIIVYCL